MTTEPGCETAGVRTYTCGNDDSHTRTEDIDPVGHDWGEGTVTKEATLSEKGERLYTCKRDESHTKTEEIPMLKPAAPAPTDAPKSDIPKTGDEAQPVLWLVLMLAAAAMVGAFVVGRTRKN